MMNYYNDIPEEILEEFEALCDEGWSWDALVDGYRRDKRTHIISAEPDNGEIETE
jgi:hypothetical protein